MSDSTKRFLLIAAAALALLHFSSDPVKEPPCPGPLCPAPAPTPPAPPKPLAPPRPWLPNRIAPVGATVGGRVSPQGVPVQIDLPLDRHQINKGGRDGSGLCVFTSIGMCADWANVASLIDFRDWMTKHPGGGYPAKVDTMLARLCAERNVPVPAYVQIEAADLELLEIVVKSGRSVGVTYCWSPTGRYGGGRIAHMVNLVHADGDTWGILDNNFIRTIEWMNRDEFRRTFTGNGGGWAVFLLAQGPPPVPRNVHAGDATPSDPYAHDCPADPDAEWQSAIAEVRELLTPGVMQRPFAGDQYSISGKQATRDQIIAALHADAGKPRLTIVGGAMQLPPELAARFSVAVFAADAWQLRPFKLDADARFTASRFVAIVQDAAGRVVHAQYAADVQQLRDADPSYDPSRNPDGSKRSGLSLDSLRKRYADLIDKAKALPVEVWIVGGVLLLIWWNRKDESPVKESK